LHPVGDGEGFKLSDALVWDIHAEGGEEAGAELLGKALMILRKDVD